MGFLDKLIQSVFSEKSTNSTCEPSDKLVKKVLKRSDKFLADYNKWVDNQSYNFIIRSLFEEWETRNEISSVEASFFFYNTKMSNGFLYYFDRSTDKQTAHYLLTLFADRVKTLGYLIKHQEEEVIEESDFLKVKEVIYLKPRLKYRVELPYKQLFGNIHLECVWHDGSPYYIKVMANYYSDKSYDVPYSFEDLVAQIFVF
jgi:hypothetical protein